MDDLTIPVVLDRRPVIGSFTLLNTFKNVCPHQAYRRFIRRDTPFVKTDATTWGNQVHEAFANRIMRGVVLPDAMRDWEHFMTPFDDYDAQCELKLGINFNGQAVGYFDGSTWFRTAIDVAVIVNDKALLTDWKTGSSKYEDSFELEINALCLKAKYPQLRKIVGRYIYLKENIASKMYDLSNFEQTWQEIHRLMAAIKTSEWEKRKSGLCGWCPVQDCEHWYRK